MRKAGKNEPEGKAYATAFSDWLKAHHFDDIDKSDRAKLLQIMESLEDVEAWRASLSPAERLRLNHPNSVWRAFTAFQQGRLRRRRDRGDRETIGSSDEGEHSGRDGLETNLERGRNKLLELINEMENETGLAERPPVEDPKRVAALRAIYDEKVLAILEGGAQRLLKFIAVVRKLPKEQPAPAKAA
jgi:hypothetical protein